MSTKQQGLVGVGTAIAYFTSKGCVVCTPINDSQDYDLVVEIDGSLKKVQVKTTRSKAPSGEFKVCLKSSGGTAGEVYHRVGEGSSDLLYVMTEAGDNYLIPTSEVRGMKSSLTLSGSWIQYKLP